MTPFAAYLESARARPELWRLLVGCVLIAIVSVAGAVGVFAVAALHLDATGQTDLLNQLQLGITRLGMTLFLVAFLFMLLGAWLAARMLHRRGLPSIFGPWSEVKRHFLYGVVVAWAFLALATWGWSLFYDTTEAQPLRAVLRYMPLVVVLIALQTAAEEVVFRGYIPQQLAARFNSPWVWLLFPQVLFGLLHYDPGAMGQWAWVYVVIITMNGLMWMDLVRITGTLGAAWGWHFANNFVAMGLISAPGGLSGFAWRVLPYEVSATPPPVIAMDALLSACIWLTLRTLFLRRESRPRPSV